MLRFGLFTVIVSLIIVVFKSVVVIHFATGFWEQLGRIERIIQYMFVISQDLMIFGAVGSLVAVLLVLNRGLMVIVSTIIYGLLRFWYGLDSIIMMLTASRVTLSQAITFLDYIPMTAMSSGIRLLCCMILLMGYYRWIGYKLWKYPTRSHRHSVIWLFPQDHDLSRAVIILTLSLTTLLGTQIVQSLSYQYYIPIIADHRRKSPLFLQQSYFAMQGGRITNTHYEDRYRPLSGLAQSHDIILLFAESLSQIDSVYAGGLVDLFPNYDRAARQGMVMTNFISNGCTSDAAHVAVLQGVNPWMHEGVIGETIYRAYTGLVEPLALFARAQGFHPSFYSTVPLDFLDQEGFLRRMGFEDIVGPDAFPKGPTYTFDAQPDAVLFQKILADLPHRLVDDVPQLLVAQTISTHLPFNAPYGNTWEEVARYADDAFGRFYDGLVSQGFFDHGILIVVGDHRKMTPVTKKELDMWGRSAAGRVVGFVVGTGIASGQIFSPLIQHTDIHFAIKQFIAQDDILIPPFWSSLWTPSIIRDVAVRFCSFVERDYVINRRYDIPARQKDVAMNDLTNFIADYERFQGGERKQGGKSFVLTVSLLGLLQTGSIRVGPRREPWTLRENQKNQKRYRSRLNVIDNHVIHDRGHGLSGVVLVGHGGAPAYEPYNSYAGFSKAIQQGADAIEFDISFTKDLVPIVAHGPDLWSPACRGLQIKHTFWKKIRTDCPLKNGEQIMDLETMLRQTRDFVPWYILEIKTEGGQNGIRHAQIVISIIRSLGMQDVVTVITYDPQARWYIGTLRDIRPAWDTFDTNDIDLIHSGTRYEYFMTPFHNRSRDLLSLVKRKGMRGMTYTPKTKDDLLRARRLGVREFMVDNIPWAIEVIRAEQESISQQQTSSSVLSGSMLSRSSGYESQ